MDQLPRDRFDEYRGSQREVRTGLSRFCEQLALLDGGTIALVATNAVSHSGQLRHRYTLAVGLGFLAIGLIGLLLRNLAETERTAADDLWHYRLFTEGGRAADRTAGPKLWRYAKYTKALQWVGIVSTLVGLLSLVIVLTLLIIS